MSLNPPYSRRQFLRETFAFSALALLGGRSQGFSAPPLDTAGHHMLLVGDWGWDLDQILQTGVAHAMTEFVQTQQIRPEALVLLGDNFYGQLEGLEKSPRWQTQFEDMYPRSSFDCPCYALLGNHDYNVEPAGKAEAQLAYAKKPGTRWKMPEKWYRFEFPAVDPLVTFLMLDSNYQKATPEKLSLTDDERAAQSKWLEEELAKPRHTQYLIVCGHHPLYSNGHSNFNKPLVKAWDASLRSSKAHVYFCGHEHDLQHIEFAEHPTSFVVSGGGGARLSKFKQDPNSPGPFGKSAGGFTHLQITSEKLLVRHVDIEGKTLHGFTKTPEGKMTLLG